MLEDNEISMCEECETRFYDYGFICLPVMQVITEKYFSDMSVIYDDFFHDRGFLSSVKFLERKGFLVSTEIENRACVVKLNKSTFSFNNELNTVCWCSFI